MVTITYPDTKTISYAYNDQGKVKRRTDQRAIVTWYGYNKLRAMTVRTTDPAVACDPIAQAPNYVPDPDRTTETFSYDGLGRILAKLSFMSVRQLSMFSGWPWISSSTDFLLDYILLVR